MSYILRLLMLVATLLSRQPVCCTVRGDVLDIILRSDGSLHSGNSVNGLNIDFVNGSTASLEAVAQKKSSGFIQVRLDWYKDGQIVDAPYKMRRTTCEGKDATIRCSLVLQISAVAGANKSGNYSVVLLQGPYIGAAAHVNIVVGERQAVEFTTSPSPVVNCSAGNSSVFYAAVGFPTPVYSLSCLGWHYTSEPSLTGTFVIPPEVCCAGAICRATAFNGYEERISNSVVIREEPVGSLCQQYVGCLSPRFEVFAQSCMSAPGSGNTINSKSVNLSDDDSVAALVARTYQKVSSNMTLQLNWYKDGSPVDAPRGAQEQICVGNPHWGPWMFCTLRLPLAVVNGTRSGNYSATLSVEGLVTSAWVEVSVGGLQGMHNCSTVSDTLANPSSSSALPFTCGQFSALSYATVPYDYLETAHVSSTVIIVTLGTAVLAAIIALVVCNRLCVLPKQVIWKHCPAPNKTRCRSDMDQFTAKQLPASYVDSDLSQDRVKQSRDTVSRKPWAYEQRAPYSQLAAEEVEEDGVFTAMITENTFGNDLSSLPPQCTRRQLVNMHSLSTAEPRVVHDPLAKAVTSEHRPSVTLVIHAQNVQVGAMNTMVIQGNVSSSSTTDSDYGSMQDGDTSCMSPAPVFDD